MGNHAVHVNGVTISLVNRKLGRIANISLPPCKSCAPDVPCRKQCYALKAYRMYKGVRAAWDANLVLAALHREEYFEGIREFLQSTKVNKFRWHVAGDILDQNYYDWMAETATNFPSVQFLCFTKRHDLDFATNHPANLTIVLSMWPGWGDTAKDMPRAWLDDGHETRIPDTAVVCPGNCEACAACFALGGICHDVTFKLH